MTPRRPGIYARISDDREDDRAGVKRQEADVRALLDRIGWGEPTLYVENDTSAFKRRRVRLPSGEVAMRVDRPVFRRLLEDLAGGLIDGLAAYDLDRVARDPRDMEDLIDVCERYGRPTASCTGMDLSTDTGILTARNAVNYANQASRASSRRIKRKHEELAQQGRPGGGGRRPYGFDGAGMTIVEEEAAVVRSIAAQVLAGVPLRAIATALTAKGVPTVYGGPWNARSVHSVVSKARNAGLREFRGEIVGRASWPAVLSQEVWEQVRVTLTGRGRGATNRLTRWATGLLRCGLCGHVLTGSMTANRAHRYWCATTTGGCGRIAIRSDIAEARVEKIILRYLARPDVFSVLAQMSSETSISRAREDLRADQLQLTDLATLWGKRQISTSEYLAARSEIEARMRRWSGLLESAAPGSVRQLLQAEHLPSGWSELGPSEKRTVARAILPLGFSVAPHDRAKGNKPDPTRVKPVKGGSATR